uniref:Uncharacterized protein n=1 Tax=Oryza glumipatula TaxID=40148 RepID=A0A0E0AC43_9ORYZ
MVDKRSGVVDGVVMCHAVRTGLVPTPKPHADPVRVAETGRRLAISLAGKIKCRKKAEQTRGSRGVSG